MSPVRIPQSKLTTTLLPIGVFVLITALVAPALSGGDTNQGGAAPYTPTQGEWLCLVLNTQRALVNSEQQPLDMQVRYLYNRTRPNTIQIELLFGENVPRVEVQRRAEDAQLRALDAAKVYGWDKWLKLDFKETHLSDAPGWENLYR